MPAIGSSLSFDLGQTKGIFNKFAIPNTIVDRVSLPKDKTMDSYRITGYFDLSSGNQIYFLIAPLETSFKFNSTKPFEFDNQNFLSGEQTEVNYKFSSYRLGYLWKWKFSHLKIWSGFIGKIRDAEIEVVQGNKSRSFKNVGFVPLASFGFEASLFSSLSIYSHTDALSAKQGSAYDSQLELRYKLSNSSISIGKRVLGGGADNENLYNFAQFDTIYTRIGIFF